ncbi:putative Exosome complex exonuclease [Giardia muris]|uniref:Putative Exosome complex exonuclease n=1 Tax=Giardia muris TaxID=5742 RepID=A0A4Z1T8E1_GIAMU|nr:putative Exosome complex exonuclease [Giardia muris]|eukprot:TNJ28781.1 putative Exosome complex exonuclease [Giardia muris]
MLPEVLPGDRVEGSIPSALLITVDGVTYSHGCGHLTRGLDQEGQEGQGGDRGQGELHLVSPYGSLYLPRQDDVVIGHIIGFVPALGYRVDVRSFVPALLPLLAFDNASRRTTTVLPNGSHVVARVSYVPPGLGGTVELSCLHGLGPLVDPEGRSIEFSLSAVFNPPRRLLSRIASKTPFSIRLAANGRAWITALTLRDTLSVCHSLLQS